ncbi:MAG: RNA polymerase sigma factor [Thermonemataceae bacterium]|nr:RNA polymerase sigma factor [Thermonemataceae bacterium]
MDCQNFSDSQLVYKSIENSIYFECLYKKYEYKLTRFVSRNSNFGTEIIQDILQDAFIKIWKNIRDFDDSQSFSTWAYRIVYNETVSYWRKSTSFGKNKTKDISNFLNLSAENNELSFEKEEKVMRIINKLPQKYKSVLILKYFEDMGYEEISDVLQIPEGTVATHLNRARKMFFEVANNMNVSFID